MDTNETLLPCPFCAHEAKLEEGPMFRYAVYCTYQNCACCTSLCTSPKYAVLYWNRRDWKPNESASTP